MATEGRAAAAPKPNWSGPPVTQSPHQVQRQPRQEQGRPCRQYLLTSGNKKIEIKSEKKIKISKILILGPNLRNINIKKKLISDGYKVDIFNKKIDLEKIKNNNYDFLISSGYPFKINKKIVSNFKNKIIVNYNKFISINVALVSDTASADNFN